MCQICELAASQVGPNAPRLSGFAIEPNPRMAAPVNLEAAHGAAASVMPEGVGVQGRRTLIKGGTVLSMDERVGNHAVGDVLIDGSKIAEVAARIDAPDAAVIDASGHIVTPGFIDAHSHQFETALRSFLADGILINDGRPESAHNYYEFDPAETVARLPAAGRLHQRAVRRHRADRRRRDRGHGHQPDPSLARTFRRGDRGAARGRPARGVRLFRGLGRKGEISRRRQAHPRTALLVIRPAHQHVHGRRDLFAGL